MQLGWPASAAPILESSKNLALPSLSKNHGYIKTRRQETAARRARRPSCLRSLIGFLSQSEVSGIVAIKHVGVMSTA